ncbi:MULTISPECIES: hypothetical protein [unclassified Mesorhizobium]|uniref:hypothetical protein n=1 Tax=unclassified Mesorhizobium TaxID=325217 RepID=UPI00112D9F58|nr:MULTISPECIES: hypothetical protein [unclassified Mesorhizobium]TPL00608.1 hypothetical protein FJ567_13705 [Mesorhizobium sp. B2-4-16]TPL63651.1 hypothetical protein FJ956_23145 [Mesorhizobium sp. B2-4-3]
MTNGTVKSGRATGSSISFVSGNIFGNTASFSGTINGSTMSGTYRQTTYGGVCSWEVARMGNVEAVSAESQGVTRPEKSEKPTRDLSGPVNVPVCGGRGTITFVHYNTQKQSGVMNIRLKDGAMANLNVGPSPRKKVSSASGLADAYGDLIDRQCSPHTGGEPSLVNTFGGAIRSFVTKHLLQPDANPKKQPPPKMSGTGIRG